MAISSTRGNPGGRSGTSSLRSESAPHIPSAAPETRDAGVAEILAVAELDRRVIERRPEFVLTAGVVEIGRHDANDLGIAAVETDLAVEDGGIAAKSPLPQRVAEYGDGGGTL